jgi:hypothetical protein
VEANIEPNGNAEISFIGERLFGRMDGENPMPEKEEGEEQEGEEEIGDGDGGGEE